MNAVGWRRLRAALLTFAFVFAVGAIVALLGAATAPAPETCTAATPDGRVSCAAGEAVAGALVAAFFLLVAAVAGGGALLALLGAWWAHRRVRALQADAAGRRTWTATEPREAGA